VQSEVGDLVLGEGFAEPEFQDGLELEGRGIGARIGIPDCDAQLAGSLLQLLAGARPHEEVALIVGSGVAVVEIAGNNPGSFVEVFKANGITTIHKCTSVRHALKAESLGVNIVSIDGFECAGHPGEDDVPGLVLIPAATARLRIPVLASEGIADGRGLVAALALGAEGISMGTRFMCTQEVPIHPRIKDAIVAATELDTELIFRSLRNTSRVTSNSVSREAVEVLANGGVFDDVRELVAGSRGRRVYLEGDPEHGVWAVGMIQALIHDVPACEELVARIVQDAEALIDSRLRALTR
jgi:NAD(P)H-dependent flavin oxidoreductase YrpB (nitropropane dioxygenase family)